MGMKSSSRGGARIRLVGAHTAEGARTAANLRAYFDRPDVQASSHSIIDHDDTLRYVPEERAAWTLRSGNPISLNAEICAFAKWSRAQWLSNATVDGCANPYAMVIRFADWAREMCDRHNIPKVKLSSADVKAGKAGIIGHINWTEGMRDGSHWDPGPGFPWDVVMARIHGQSSGGGSTPPAAPEPIIMEDDMPHETRRAYQDDGWDDFVLLAEVGAGSADFKTAYLQIGAGYGQFLYRCWGMGAKEGGELIDMPQVTTRNYKRSSSDGTIEKNEVLVWKLPEGFQGVTVEFCSTTPRPVDTENEPVKQTGPAFAARIFGTKS